MSINTLIKKIPKKRKRLYILVFFLLFFSLIAYLIFIYSLSHLEILVFSPGYLVSGTDASIRIIVIERKNAQPVNEAMVSIILKNKKTNRQEQVFSGMTGSNGSPAVKFKVPGDFEGDCQLKVKVRSAPGNENVSIPITVRKGFKILLTADNEVYCPGQVIHIRGVVFYKARAAKKQKVKIEAYEPKGNKVFEKEPETCAYGIANTDFTLGDEINKGTYTIRASIGEYQEEINVKVIDHTPPKFKIASHTDKTWYRPGQVVKGTVKAAYFYGKSVSNGKVSITFFNGNKAAPVNMTELNGTTNSMGVFQYAYQLPQQLPGQPLRLDFDITVEDERLNTETLTCWLPVSKDEILVELTPGGGNPKMGLENTIYIKTHYPDGKPCACNLKLELWHAGKFFNIKKITGIPVKTNSRGMGQLKVNLIPGPHDNSLHLVTRGTGRNPEPKVWNYLISKHPKESIILRTGKSTYNVGETAVFTILSTRKQGHVYLDLFQNNRLILTGETRITNGKGRVSLPIDKKLPGTLTCYARMITTPGKPKGTSLVLEDVKKIIVNPDDVIDVALEPDKKRYSPGEVAHIRVVTTRAGKGCKAALGIDIKDRSIREDCGLPAGNKPEVRFSPRALYHNPRLITDSRGRASFTVNTMDSISQWQVSALAHIPDGTIGTGHQPLKVSPVLFVEPELPHQLTRGDEIAVPVSIYNYLASPQKLILTLRLGNWFNLSGSRTRTVTVRGNNDRVEYFKIKTGAIGNHRMELLVSVPGAASTVSGRLAKNVNVVPAGKEIHHTFKYNLKESAPIVKDLVFPETMVEDSERLFVKVYPGILSQLLEGLESMLQMPGGCFEQTSSILYPDILVLEYLKKTGLATPEHKEKAKRYIARGYQKMLRYEAEDGGFSFYGGKETQKVLTAYGLLIFSDMERFYPIEGDLIPRTQKWLLSQMNIDHWQSDSHFGAAAPFKDNEFTATAYITWALLHSGIDKRSRRIQKALKYLEKNFRSYFTHANALSYCALALTEADRNPGPVIAQLNKLAKNDQFGFYWPPAPSGASGDPRSTAYIETTAIAALANLEAGNSSFDVLPVLYYLLENKNTAGTWDSTQATVLTLKVLIEAVPKSSDRVYGMIDILMNNQPVEQIIFHEENNMKRHVVDLKKYIDVQRSRLQLKYEGRGELFCQVVSSYYLNWDDPSLYQTQSPIRLDLIYDPTKLTRNETLTAKAAVFYNGKGLIHFSIIEIGIPPGFRVHTDVFKKIKAKQVIDHFEINEERILLYLSNLDQKVRRFQFGLKPITVCRVKIPGARIYDYYNPSVSDMAQPVELIVSEVSYD